MNLQEQKTTFFELGRTLFWFFNKNGDQYEYEILCKIASSLGLEVPDTNEFMKDLMSSGETTEKWFSDPNGEFKKYFDLGKYAAIYYRSYPGNIRTRHPKRNEEIGDLLLSLCAKCGIPREIIDDYLSKFQY